MTFEEWKKNILFQNEEELVAKDAFAAGAASRDAEIAGLVALLTRYRNETPVGHQPHMIAHLVDEALAKVRKP